MRKFSVSGDKQSPTNYVRIELSHRVRKSEELMQIMVDAVHAELGEHEHSVWISPHEGKVIVEVPVGFVRTFESCQIFRGSIYQAFNTIRGAEKKKLLEK
jgi:hypothetical protein